MAIRTESLMILTMVISIFFARKHQHGSRGLAQHLMLREVHHFDCDVHISDPALGNGEVFNRGCQVRDGMLQPVLDGSGLGTFTRHRVNDIVDHRNRAVRSITSIPSPGMPSGSTAASIGKVEFQVNAVELALRGGQFEREACHHLREVAFLQDFSDYVGTGPEFVCYLHSSIPNHGG